MKKLLLISSSPVKSGNGDALLDAAEGRAKELGAFVSRVDIRDMEIHPCRACRGCADTGVCVQKDGFEALLKEAHDADAIILAAPVYYNCMAAQAMLAVNRLCCTFTCKTYQIGPRKRVAVFLTCTGSTKEVMDAHIDSILTLPSVSRSVSEYRTELFRGCVAPDTCRNSEEYIKRAENACEWVLAR